VKLQTDPELNRQLPHWRIAASWRDQQATGGKLVQPILAAKRAALLAREEADEPLVVKKAPELQALAERNLLSARLRKVIGTGMPPVPRC